MPLAFGLDSRTSGVLPAGRQGCWVIFCWEYEPGVSSNPLVLIKKRRGEESERVGETDYDVVFALIVLPFPSSQQPFLYTLTAWFTWLSLVTSAATKGRLEVMDGLLKDLPLSALMTDDNGHCKSVHIFRQRLCPCYTFNISCLLSNNLLGYNVELYRGKLEVETNIT